MNGSKFQATLPPRGAAAGTDNQTGLGLTADHMMTVLPQALRLDDGARAVARVIAEELERRGLECDLPRLWPETGRLDGAVLDILAEDLGLTWYNRDAAAEVKRAVLARCGQVANRLGTKWAVEDVITTYFGEGYLTEWFQYEGQPGHFRVYSTNPSVNNERLEEFLRLLEAVKRTSALLDGVFITLTGQMPMCAGMAVRETAVERVEMS